MAKMTQSDLLFCSYSAIQNTLFAILFTIYMDVLIDRLRVSRFRCRLAGEFFGCIVYADDVLLLSHSVEALRHMLTICENFAVDFDVKFNSNKSVFYKSW